MAKIMRILHGIFDREQEYTVNGVRYIVETKFQPLTEPVATLNSRMERIIKNDIAHLTISEASGTIEEEYVYPTAGKENNAVEKEN